MAVQPCMEWNSSKKNGDLKKFEEMTWRLTEHEGKGARAGGRRTGKSNSQKQNTDKTSKCDWNFMAECLTISVSTEWLKNFHV